MENKIDMKRKIFGIIAVMVLLLFVACDKKERLDPKADYVLINAFESARNQSDKEIDVEFLKNSAVLYEKGREFGKVCLCDALIGCKLFFDGDYDKSLIYLKRAEKNLQYCDSMSSFVYAYIVKNTMTTDTLLALNYAKMALGKNLEYNNLRRLPYSYMNLSLLTKGDSARYYLDKSLEYFDDWGDKLAKCKYAWWHIDELHPDTVIAYAKPYYDISPYAGHARVLAEAYLRKGEPDSALMYIEATMRHPYFRADGNFYNSRRLNLLGKYKEASESWEKAYYQQREEFLFMFSQRLGAINAEYDLLNEELENKKEKLRMRGIYNALLIMVIVVLVVTYIIKESYRKSAHKLKINVNELEQEVGVLEQNVDDLKQEVSCLEQEVSGLELEVSKQKGRYAVLFDMYKQGYNVDRKTMVVDAQKNLNKLHEEYTDLTKTDLTIIWLTFMDCSRDMICDLMNITQKYYYQRKSLIQQILGIPIRNEEGWNKTLESIVMRYINELNIRR
jgi:cell division protein FtsB